MTGVGAPRVLRARRPCSEPPVHTSRARRSSLRRLAPSFLRLCAHGYAWSFTILRVLRHVGPDRFLCACRTGASIRGTSGCVGASGAWSAFPGELPANPGDFPAAPRWGSRCSGRCFRPGLVARVELGADEGKSPHSRAAWRGRRAARAGAGERRQNPGDLPAAPPGRSGSCEAGRMLGRVEVPRGPALVSENGRLPDASRGRRVLAPWADFSCAPFGFGGGLARSPWRPVSSCVAGAGEEPQYSLGSTARAASVSRLEGTARRRRARPEGERRPVLQ
jgi:hypothetical protein